MLKADLSGNALNVELRDVSLANAAGGSKPAMVDVARLKAEIAPWSLIVGPIVIRHLSVDGASVLLEHASDDRPNWRMASAGRGNGRRPAGTALLDGHFNNIEIDVRTSGGTLLRTHIGEASVAAADDKTTAIDAEGAYNGSPVHLSATLPALSALHKGGKLPTTFVLTSGAASLSFKGTATDPVGLDGLEGRLDLNAPKPQQLLAMAAIPAKFDKPVTLGGAFSHKGVSWSLASGVGTLDGDPLKVSFDLEEGARHQPDNLTLDADFKTLDVNAFVASGDPAPQPPGDTSLLVDSSPDPLFDAHIAAGHVIYRTIEADEFDLKAKVAPGLLTVDQIALRIAGGSAKSQISIVNRDGKGVVDFNGALVGVDAAGMAKLLGWGQLPISGPIDSRVSGNMTGATLAQARTANRIYAVVSMDRGTIDRKLVRLASTDIRLLFGGRTGTDNLTCLLSVTDLNNGVGTIAPIRIKTSSGTIVGGGSYDARHDVVDLAIGTQSSTTSIFALDVPVRISGPTSDFSIRPTTRATARQLATSGTVGKLPSDLQAFASANACATP